MYKVAIVEDDDRSAGHLAELLERYQKENDVVFGILRFNSGLDFICSEEKFDIIFMDIDMQQMDGYSAAKKLREKDENAILIFVTNMAEYAIKGYDVEAFAFITKPVGYLNISLKLKKALDSLRWKKPYEIVIKEKDTVRCFLVNDLYYVEVIRHDLIYHTDRGNFHVRETLKNAEKQLAQYGFAKCNHCYLVNLLHVTGLTADSVTVGGDVLQVSRSKRKDFIAALTEFARSGK